MGWRRELGNASISGILGWIGFSSVSVGAVIWERLATLFTHVATLEVPYEADDHDDGDDAAKDAGNYHDHLAAIVLTTSFVVGAALVSGCSCFGLRWTRAAGLRS
jgi:hypothetical protein